MANRRYELVNWRWCSVHLGVASPSYEICSGNIVSAYPCEFWPLYAARGTTGRDGSKIPGQVATAQPPDPTISEGLTSGRGTHPDCEDAREEDS